MNVCVAQLELVTGDLDGNTAKILEVIRANEGKADFIVFPELAVTGYNCGALFESEEFVDAALTKLEEIREATGESVVIVGCPSYCDDKHEPNGNLRLHNSAFILHRKGIISVYPKILLANDFQHEDRKYFIPGDQIQTFFYKGLHYGVLVCEDSWRNDHDRDLIAEMKAESPDLGAVFCINYSYATYTKRAFRYKLLGELARDHKVSIVYLNVVGVGDIVKNFIAYDGNSMVFNARGHMTHELPKFEECIMTIPLHSTPTLLQPVYPEAEWRKYEAIWQQLLYMQKRIYELCRLKKAQVHVSGGIDSAVVAVLCAKAMGPENCIFITNPSRHNGEYTKNNAQSISDKLGVPLTWIPIEEPTNELLSKCDNLFAIANGTGQKPNIVNDKRPSEVPFVVGTAQATMRSVVGLAMANYYGSGIVATGNHTENVLGWFTFHDIGSIGVWQPIGDLTKAETMKLARFINMFYREELIPKDLYEGFFSDEHEDFVQPMAELADAKQDPFDYRIYSGICAEIIRNRKTPQSLVYEFETQTLDEDSFDDIDVYKYPKDVFEKACWDAWNRAKRSVYKCAQAAPPAIISPRSRGFSSRETIINYYDGKVAAPEALVTL